MKQTLAGSDAGFGADIFKYLEYKSDDIPKIVKVSYIRALTGIVCEVESNTKVVETFEEYAKERTGSYSIETTSKNDKKKDIIYSLKQRSTSQSNLNQGNEKQIKNLFRDQTMEMFLTKAECRTSNYEVTNFGRKKFTDTFIDALRSFDELSYNGTFTEKYNEFLAFVEDFGFFYIKSVDVGARLIYQKLYTSRSSSSKDVDTRVKCEAAAVYKGIENGVEIPGVKIEGGYKAGFNVGFASAEVSVKVDTTVPGVKLSDASSFEGNSKKCGGGKEDVGALDKKKLTMTSIYSIGSPPTDLKTWVDQKWQPFPLNYTIRDISYLFDPRRRGARKDIKAINKNFPDEKPIKIENVYKVYVAMRDLYCTKEKIDCSGVQEQGCGIRAKCPFGERCVNDLTQPNGFRCLKGNKTSCPEYHYLNLACYNIIL